MDNKYSVLLGLFVESQGKIISIDEINLKLGFSRRSILRYINIINSMDDNESFCIVSVKNKGYRLQVFKEEKFNEFYESIANFDFTFEYNELILSFVLEDLSSARLEKKFNYSKPSIVRMITSANEKLANRGLQIKHKRNVYCLEGNEIQIRNLGNYLWSLSNFDLNKLSEEKRNEYTRYIDYLQKNKIADSDELKNYLFISLVRSVQGHNIEFSPVIRDFYDKENTDNELSNIISDYYFKNYEIKIPKDELFFISLAIKGNNPGVFNENINVIMVLVKNILKGIDVKYGTVFENDNELLNSICSHIASNISNYLLMSKVDNALLDKIRLNYTNEHVYALELANALSEALNIRISDEDVGYITLHFANCNEKKKKDITIESTIVVSRSTTTAKILKLRLNDVYPQMQVSIKKIGEDISKKSLKIVFEDDIDIKDNIRITPFLDEKDKKKVDSAIVEKMGYEPFIKLCSEDDFFFVDKVRSKNEFFSYANKILVEKGRLDSTEAENIIERENLTSTEIAPGVAFPHCIVKGKSFISIFILKQPIFWNSSYVRLVMVMGYNKSGKKNQEAIKYLFFNIANQTKTNKLIQTESFKEFIEILRGN